MTDHRRNERCSAAQGSGTAAGVGEVLRVEIVGLTCMMLVAGSAVSGTGTQAPGWIVLYEQAKFFLGVRT